MPFLFKTLLICTILMKLDNQLHKFDLTLFSYGSPNIGNTSAETYSIFLEDKLFTIFIVGFTEKYKDKLIAIVSFDNQYEFTSVIKHIKREMYLDLESLKSQLIFESGDSKISAL